MANLNIPFLLFQPQTCEFEPSLKTSKLIGNSKYITMSHHLQKANFNAMNNGSHTSIPINSKTFFLNFILYSGSQDRSRANHLSQSQQQTNANTLQYDDKMKNLMIFCDNKTGSIILAHEEHYISQKKDSQSSGSQMNLISLAADPSLKERSVNKFIVNIVPRVMLIPSISQDPGPVLDYTFVQSPAPYILSTSQYFLVTLHDDNIIRLWNTNDGRCIQQSQKEMFVTKTVSVKRIKKHPGNIVVIGQSKDIYIVNVYKMIVYKHFQSDIEGYIQSKFIDKQFVICDTRGKIYIWKDDSEPSPIKNPNSSLMIELTSNQDDFETFSYNLDCSVGERDDIPNNKVLGFKFVDKDHIYVVTEARIDFYIERDKRVLYEFGIREKLIFAKFIKYEDRGILIVIDSNLNLYAYDETKLKHEAQTRVKYQEPMRPHEHTLIIKNLLNSSRFFEQYSVKTEGSQSMLNDAVDIKQDSLNVIRQQIILALTKTNFSERECVFKYSTSENILYTIIKHGNQQKIVSWSLRTMLENLVYVPQISEEAKIPMFMSTIQLSNQNLSQSLINFQPLQIRNMYNQKYQYQFFFSDEKITDSVVFQSTEYPSLIIGTNYGRIFMIQMFQEEDERILPVVLFDSHHKSPISQLFIAYNTSRRPNTQSHGVKVSASSLDNGGHLISVSEDGTIAVTNLNSSEIHRLFHNYRTDEKYASRVNDFFEEKQQNYQQKRRNSFTQYFSLNNYYQLVKAKSQQIFEYTTFGKINKILEVKDLLLLQDKLVNKHKSKVSHTPDRPQEGILGGDYSSQHHAHSPQRRGSFSGLNGLGEGRGGHDKKSKGQLKPAYACIGSDGVVFILYIQNLIVEMQKLTGLDSEAIGIYENEDMQQYYILTENLNFFVYSKKSNSLERKGDFKFALNILMIKETFDHLISHNEPINLASKQGQNVFDFDTFDKIFKNHSLLTGQKNHKVIDYLGLSIDLPLKYNPHTAYQKKYTRSVHELLQVRKHIAEFYKKEDSQKVILKTINDCFFLNNKIYKSDYNEELFLTQSGAISIITGENTVMRSKQNIIIANTKQMIKVMQHRANKMKNLQNNYQQQRPAQNQRNLQEEKKITDSDMFVMKEVQYDEGPGPKLQTQPSLQNRNNFMNDQSNIKQSKLFTQYKWPTRLMSVIHPFNIDQNVDENLDYLFQLSLPFLDFRVGVQGIQESFSFVITKEDEDYHYERNNPIKALKMLKLSNFKREQLDKISKFEENKDLIHSHSGGNGITTHEELERKINMIMEVEPETKFFGSEQWKISNYLSTILPAFMLSFLLGTIDNEQNEINEQVKAILNDWVGVLQNINQHAQFHGLEGVSISVISKFLMKKEHNISATGRDLILKPILNCVDKDYYKACIDEWTQLIQNTYKQLKKDTNIKKSYGGQQNAAHQPAGYQGQQNQMQQQQQQLQQASGNKNNISQFFGELEIRCLSAISYYALYHHDQLEANLQYRISKLTTILSREIVDKFKQNKKYIHLLTLLLQLLGVWMKSSSTQFNNKQIIHEVIRLLLFIYNINKQPLNKENIITRVTKQNFHLVRPNHAEMYLKLTAAKVLLEIGENFTHEYLMMIQEEASHLTYGPEYQQNVLESLKFFINGYGDHLEQYLIQITQILLKCLDPNDLPLRKISHKMISLILSVMVKLFPMVAFHHESQRLAVGTHDGPIALYDVRTSAKWKILEGHTANVTCIAFDSKGNMLASYSAVDLTLRLWKVGNTGFFSTIMGGTGKCSNQINLKKLNVKNPHASYHMRKTQTIQQQELNENNNLLQVQAAMGGAGNTGQSGKSVNRCSVKFLMPKEKEVELIREDGQREVHKLVK